MSNRNNVVFNVLPTESTLAILADGGTIDSLAAGQIGFFDAETKLSIDTTVPVPKEFFIALGKGNGDFRMSAGQAIQKKGITGFTEQAPVAGSPMVVTLATTKAKCDTEYGIRIEFRNSRIYRFQGFNQFSKAFIVKTPCCDDCNDDCNSYDSNLLFKLFRNEINADIAQTLEARLVTPIALNASGETGVVVPGLSGNLAIGATVSDANINAIVTYNLTATTKIALNLVITSKPIQIGVWAQVNLAYHKLLETTLIVSPLEDSNLCSYITVSNTFPTFAQGTGSNLMNKEYHASGWNGAGPYVLSETTGTPKGNIEYLAKQDVSYHQFDLEYEVKAHGGWLEYENGLTTIIAIKAGNTAAIQSVREMLQHISA